LLLQDILFLYTNKDEEENPQFLQGRGSFLRIFLGKLAKIVGVIGKNLPETCFLRRL